MNCPKCGAEINAGSILARLGKDRPKRYTPAEIKLRTARLQDGAAKARAATRQAPPSLIPHIDSERLLNAAIARAAG